jgi:NAD dependent epimerase/dehydratase family enzyme
MIFGEMHNILFESQKVSSKKIENKGFKFKFNILRDAIENILQ